MAPVNLSGPAGSFTLALGQEDNRATFRAFPDGNIAARFGAVILRATSPEADGFASTIGAVAALLAATAVAISIASSAGAATVSANASADGGAIVSASGAATCLSAGAGQSEILLGGAGSSAGAASVAGAGAASASTVGVVSAASAASAVSGVVGVNVGRAEATSDVSAVGAAIAAAQGAVDGQSAGAGAGFGLTGSAGLVAATSAAIATGAATSAVAGVVAGQSGATAVGAPRNAAQGLIAATSVGSGVGAVAPTGPTVVFFDDFSDPATITNYLDQTDWTISGGAMFQTDLGGVNFQFPEPQPTLNDDYYIKMTVQAHRSSSLFENVRVYSHRGANGSGLFGYYFEIGSDGSLSIKDGNNINVVGGATLPAGSFTPSPGDVFELRVTNSGTRLEALVNGITVFSDVDTSAKAGLKGTGFTVYSDPRIEEFEAGNL